VWTRYCPECDTEFRPDVERCSDCGGPLESRFEVPEGNADAQMFEPSGSHRAAPIPEAASLPPGRYLPFREASDFQALDSIAKRLGSAGIPFVAVATRRSLMLRVRAEDRQKADALAGGLVPAATVEVGPFDPDRGETNCPACGTALGENAEECPECHLVFSLPESSPLCRYCGAGLAEDADRCSHCHRRDPIA
jgi:hypothetical protein